MLVTDPLDETKEFIKKNGEFTVNKHLQKGTSPHLELSSPRLLKRNILVRFRKEKLINIFLLK